MNPKLFSSLIFACGIMAGWWLSIINANSCRKSSAHEARRNLAELVISDGKRTFSNVKLSDIQADRYCREHIHYSPRTLQGELMVPTDVKDPNLGFVAWAWLENDEFLLLGTDLQYHEKKYSEIDWDHQRISYDP